MTQKHGNRWDTSCYTPYTEEIKRLAALGYTRKQIFNTFPEGYNCRTLYEFIKRRGIEIKKPSCGNCKHCVYFFENGKRYKGLVCAKYHVRLRVKERNEKCMVEGGYESC